MIALFASLCWDQGCGIYNELVDSLLAKRCLG